MGGILALSSGINYLVSASISSAVKPNAASLALADSFAAALAATAAFRISKRLSIP
jgi:hypothetical protein